ncbi:hypothetical protein ANME2D_01281 [Candidatus Methanoperedens nitroreducens]|uniref:Uncharacterized protein n=1 Tax=Candidatus Methanoperedens nitratireducens TaxID=1392998 RepID=A0A062V143_9EURY|nr:hypothetical protein ANME2D_01281 [Candidatus Methanoperedens nitroreducens]
MANSVNGATTCTRNADGSGWAHIRDNHVINPSGNQFLISGSEYADESRIQNLILEGAKNG